MRWVLRMATKRAPYRMTMWAVLCDGEPRMALPTLDDAKAHYGALSINDYSDHRWIICKIDARFPQETAGERRRRQRRHVQQVVELNRAIALGQR